MRRAFFVALGFAGAFACGSNDDAGPGAPDAATPPDATAGDGSPGDDGASGDATPGADGGEDADAARPPVPGLDPSFGNGGFVNVNLQSGGETGEQVLREPDGKIVVIGRSQLTNDLLAIRLDGAGALDPTFGNGGRVQIDLPHGHQLTFPMHGGLEPDGKVVFAITEGAIGTSVSGWIYRLDASGALDPTFGQGGVVGTPTSQMGSACVQPDGKILFAGLFTQAFVTRYTVAGAPDTTFGDAGTRSWTANEYVMGVAVAPSGKILVGSYATGANAAFSATRLDADGAIDGAFGTNGHATTPMPANSFPYAMAVQPDDKVLLAGGSNGGGGAIVRFDAQGALDATFGTNGIASAAAQLRGVSVGPGGSIVAGADFGVIRRWTSAGAPDSAFSFAPQPAMYHDALAAGDGTVLGAGQSTATGGVGGFAVSRATSTGAADATFGSQGTMMTRFAGSDEMSNGALVQGDGKIVVATQTTYSIPSLVRFTPDGKVDTTFGDAGTVALQSYTQSSAMVAADANGGILVTGPSSFTVRVQRFAASGAPDPTYGTADVSSAMEFPRALVGHSSGPAYVAGDTSGNLLAIASIPATGKALGAKAVFGVSLTSARAMIEQPDGKLLVAGMSGNGGMALYLARVDASLAADPSFGPGDAGGPGQVKLDLSANDDVGRGLALQPDGKILVVGTSSTAGGYIGAEWSGSSKIFVARLDASGALDPTFGAGGVAWPDLGQNAIAYAASVQGDGAILVAGRRWTGAKNEAVLLRFTPAGALDAAYATGGVRALPIGNESGLATLTILPDGKPLATGYVHLGLGGEDVAVFRFIP